jgi:hypothetical protein
VSVTAFIDSASLHDAFAGLHVGRLAQVPKWITVSLLKCSYLLLFQNVRIVPGPGHTGRAAVVGYESTLASELPALLTVESERKAAAVRLNRWLAHPGRPLHTAWARMLEEPELEEWSELRRVLFWETPARSNPGLFNLEYSHALSSILNVTEKELLQVHTLSANLPNVKSWARGNLDEAALLADRAYNAAALIRGKYHEFLCKDVRATVNRTSTQAFRVSKADTVI